MNPSASLVAHIAEIAQKLETRDSIQLLRLITTNHCNHLKNRRREVEIACLLYLQHIQETNISFGILDILLRRWPTDTVFMIFGSLPCTHKQIVVTRPALITVSPQSVRIICIISWSTKKTSGSIFNLRRQRRRCNDDAELHPRHHDLHLVVFPGDLVSKF